MLHFAKDVRTSRLNQRSGEEELSPDFFERLFHQVELAHRDAPGKQQHIRAQAGMDEEEQFAWLVGRDRKSHGLAARALHLRSQRIGVAVANLKGPRSPRDVDQLVSRGEDGHARWLVHFDARLAARCSHRDLRRRHASSHRQHFLPSTRFGSRRDHVFTGRDGALNLHLACRRQRRVLDHHHGVCACRHGGASHDLDRLPGLDLPLKRRSRLHLPDQQQFCGDGFEVGGLHRETVASGSRKGRKVAICKHWFSEDAAQRIGQRGGLDPCRTDVPAVFQYAGAGLLEAQYGCGLCLDRHVLGSTINR